MTEYKDICGSFENAVLILNASLNWLCCSWLGLLQLARFPSVVFQSNSRFHVTPIYKHPSNFATTCFGSALSFALGWNSRILDNKKSSVTEPFFFIRSGCFIQLEGCKGKDSVHKYLLSTYSARHGFGSWRYSTEQNRQVFYAHGDYILHSVGQRQEVSVKDYISKQFHGQDSLFTVKKSYEKTKQNNMSDMVCV